VAILEFAGIGAINFIKSNGTGLLILIALIILFGGAAQLSGRSYGTAGVVVVIGAFLIVVATLFLLGGLGFG
jgi:hypothetical protein